MITEKETIKCEAVFNDEHTHRYSWKRIWNKDKPIASKPQLSLMSPNLRSRLMAYSFLPLLMEFQEDRQLLTLKA